MDRRNGLFNFVPWTCAFLTNDAQQNWLVLKDLFFTAVEACIPTKSPRKMKHAPWLTPDVLKLIRQKRTVYKRAKASNSGNVSTRYRNLNNGTKKVCNQARWEYLKQVSVETANEGDRKLFWNYVRSRRSETNNLVELKVATDTLTNHKDIADCFNRYFASVFTTENLAPLPNFPQVVRTENLTQVSTTPFEGEKRLRELNANKSCGPDDIHPRILKHCSSSLASPLCVLFNISFKCGEISDDWKIANVISLHKKGAK